MASIATSFVAATGSVAGSDPADDPRSSPPAHRVEVARLYELLLGRPADEGGLEHWVGARRDGTPLVEVAVALVTSEESLARYAGLGDSGFVARIFRDLLGGPAPPGDAARREGELAAGRSRADLLAELCRSPAFAPTIGSLLCAADQAGPLARLHLAFLGRPPERAWLDRWAGAGRPATTLSEVLASTAEFRRRYGDLDDHHFIELAHRNVLGRPPDPEGRRHWFAELGRGVPRSRMILSLSATVEFAARATDPV